MAAFDVDSHPSKRVFVNYLSVAARMGVFAHLNVLSEYVVLIELSRYIRNHNECNWNPIVWPKVPQITQATCLKRTAVYEALGRLERRGLIRSRPGNKARETIFELIWPTDALIEALKTSDMDELRSAVPENLSPPGRTTQSARADRTIEVNCIKSAAADPAAAACLEERQKCAQILATECGLDLPAAVELSNHPNCTERQIRIAIQRLAIETKNNTLRRTPQAFIVAAVRGNWPGPITPQELKREKMRDQDSTELAARQATHAAQEAQQRRFVATLESLPADELSALINLTIDEQTDPVLQRSWRNNRDNWRRMVLFTAAIAQTLVSFSPQPLEGTV
jgi:DNA-binding MarR family transcriptional regulator